MKTLKAILILSVILCFFISAAGCRDQIKDDAVIKTFKDLAEQANSVFYLIYASIEYDKSDGHITGEKGDTFYPAAENENYKSISDIKKKCESVFTAEYCIENLYDIGFNGISFENAFSEFYCCDGDHDHDYYSEEPEDYFSYKGDPLYMEIDGILYVNSAVVGSPSKMVFDFNTINIKEKSEHEVTLNIDVIDYNFYPRLQATVKMAKIEGNWRISFLFD